MLLVKHTKKGTRRFGKKMSVKEILDAFDENTETAFVVINGKPATSDKYAKPGDKVLVVRFIPGGD